MPTEDLLNASQFLDGGETQSEADAGQLLDFTGDTEEEKGPSTKPKDFLPETLNIAGMDTGVPINEKFASWLVGTGDGLIDTWNGISQILGSEEVRKDLQQDQNALRGLYNDPRFGNVARTGQVGGFLTDPLGVILPVGKGKSLWDIAKVGAATGTTFGALGYVDEEAGQTRAGNALVGMVTGGTISPALFAATRGLKGVGSKMQERAADSLLNTYQKEVMKFISEGKTPTQAQFFAQKRMGWTLRDKASLMAISGKPFNKPSINMTAYEAERNLAAMENRWTSTVSQTLDKYSIGRDIKGVAKSFASGVNKAVVPVATRIAQKDPELARELVSMEARIKRSQQAYHERVLNFNLGLRGMDEETLGKMKLLLSSGKRFKARRLYKQSGGDTKAFDDTMRILDEIYAGIKDAGYKIPELKDYFPRRVRDLEGLAAHQDSALGKEIAHFIQTHRRNPSDKEIERLVRDIANPRERATAKTGGSLRSRQKDKLFRDELPFYHDPEETLVSYINDSVTDIERAKFLTKLGALQHKPKDTGYQIDGTDLEDSIGGLLARRQAQGRYHIGDLQELTGLLKSRFTKGELAPSDAVQAFKNTTYIASLGNFKSAMTQLGDLAFAAHKNGIVNVSLELIGRIPGLQKIVTNSHKRITKEMIGLEDAIQEFAGDRNGKKALDWVLTKTGFKAMDRLGKETFINSHIRKVKKALNDPKRAMDERLRLKSKWSPVFGNETDQLVDDLAAGRFSDNVSIYLFNQLEEVQPIALSSMPQLYLDHPNGRLFYMLRSFTLKQLDLMRRDILDNLARGDAPTAFRNLTSLGTLFVLANGSADMLKDFMTGKEIEMEDTLVDNVWKLMGLNRYTGDRILQEPGQGIVNMLAPPLTVWDRVVRAPSDSAKMWEASPFNGLQIFDEMFNDGTLTRTESDQYHSQIGKFHDSLDK